VTAKAQQGFCFPHEVRETQDKGLGVFACAAIRKGSIVWRHVPGRYTVYDEPTFRAAIKDMTHADIVHELTHVFGLREFPGCLIRVHDDGVLINHSDKANLATNNSAPIALSLDPASSRYLHEVTEALRDDRYALVATRDIAEGEELTNDYAGDVVDPPFYDALCEAYGVDEDYL
jgi:SET domain-containing protein